MGLLFIFTFIPAFTFILSGFLFVSRVLCLTEMPVCYFALQFDVDFRMHTSLLALYIRPSIGFCEPASDSFAFMCLVLT